MKKIAVTVTLLLASTVATLAADLPTRTYTKAPAPLMVPSWTGFYVFGGVGGGLWAADSHDQAYPGGADLTRDQRLGGSGYFGTVGAGYDRQFMGNWVAGVFADGTFGSIKGSLYGGPLEQEGTEKLRTMYAIGGRIGYLVAPNVYSYVNGGYTGSEWSGTTLSNVFAGPPAFTTPSFHRDGYFLGGGVENSLDIFGIHAPGLFMKTEYRASEFGRITLPEAVVGGPGFNAVAATFKPWTQTVSTSLVYRFNSGSSADIAPRMYAKAPARAMTTNWTGFYVFGGAGGGLWAADENLRSFPGGIDFTRDRRFGGSGYFGTVGAGYDAQFMGNWVAGVFADGTFGSIKGSLNDPTNQYEGSEKLRTMYAVGGRIGYLVAPNVYSYVNGGYTGSEWSGTTLSNTAGQAGLPQFTTPSFHRDGFFYGGGVENSLDIFGISAPGLFMKTEYRASEFARITLPETVIGFPGFNNVAPTFKPWTQTVSTSLVYRFNWAGPVVAKY